MCCDRSAGSPIIDEAKAANLVGLQRLEGEILFHREGFDQDLMEVVGLLGEVDVALDVRLLPTAARWV